MPPRVFFIEGADRSAVQQLAETLASTLGQWGEVCALVDVAGAARRVRIEAALARGETVVVPGGWWGEGLRATPALGSAALQRAALAAWAPLQPDRIFIAQLADTPATRGRRALKAVHRALARDLPTVVTLIPAAHLPEDLEGTLRRAPPARRLGRAGSAQLSPLPVPVVQRAWPQPNALLDLYWRFAAERQEIFFRRQKAEPAPWTIDPVLQTYRFTNAYRASDRVSQYLIRQVIYDRERSFEDTIFRVLLYKFFNRIDTWERLKAEVGEPEWRTYRYDRYDACLSRALDEGTRIFSPAYIMPSGGPRDVLGRKHRTLLQLLEFMMMDLPSRLASASSMQAAYQLLLGYPMIGPFLAYQYVTDLNYSEHLGFSEMEFVMPGPGALDGLAKTFVHFGDLSPAEVIGWVAGQQDEAFARLGLSFKTLWGRKLQLIDCQNLFCEISKYTRVSHPEVLGVSGRTRIKQTFTALEAPVQVWYPPKWGLNDRLLEPS